MTGELILCCLVAVGVYAVVCLVWPYTRWPEVRRKR